MKKSLLALAVLGAFAGVASAQSSVTLFGTLDVAGKYVKADGQDRRVSESTDGINSSQLGFRGIEDLGGGLKAGFLLLSGINVNRGAANSTFWNRSAYVRLLGTNWGELRLGRDYTPTFWNQTIFDAFGTNGLGSSINVRQLYGGTRQDNSIGYFLPSIMGGFYGQGMVTSAYGTTSGGAGQTPTADRFGRYLGARVGFAAGPFDVAFAASEQRLNALSPVASQKTYNVAGSWDFGVAKLMGYFDRETLLGATESMGSISAVIPFGQSEVHLGYDRSKYKNTDFIPNISSSIDQLKATYQYNLSKRTALYTTVSRLANKDKTQATLPGAGGPTVAGGKSSGAEFGIRHFF
jgi:predicted porin